MAVREWDGEVLFLRRVIEEPANRSYGIEVARLAGLPTSIIARAREILNNLERGELDESGAARIARGRANGAAGTAQMDLFATVDGRVLEELRGIEIDRMTPIDALNVLARMAARVRGES
jgi:DNA mismatch repair protein MutS